MSSINTTVKGEGTPVILIHGFPFQQHIWDSFAGSLANSFKVYTPDLPGFGKSKPARENFSIDDVAQLMIDWMAESRITGAVVVGHSLGGYVALEMARKDPARIKALALFHSTALADSTEKKENRNRVLEFIATNGVHAFTSNFIEPLFFDKKHPAITLVRSIAMEAEENAVKGYTTAMRDRSDRQDVLREFPGNILLIGGKHDAGITLESLQKQALLSPRIRLETLSDSAHMGMFEQTDKALGLIHDFVRQSNQP